MLTIRKKDGSLQTFDPEKIITAVTKAANHCDEVITRHEMTKIIDSIEQKLTDRENKGQTEIAVYDLHEEVQRTLHDINQNVYESYYRYRSYKKELAESFHDIQRFAEGMKLQGYQENANKNSQVIATQAALLTEHTGRKLAEQYMFRPEWTTAHNEGLLYIHDGGDRWKQTHNCCLFDMANLLKAKDDTGFAFHLNGKNYQEPKSVRTAMSIAADVILAASANQYGGFSVNEFDKVMSPYAERTYHDQLAFFVQNGTPHDLAKKLAKKATIAEIEQGYQAFEYRLNTLSNALGQVPFETITFGLDTSFWGQIIIEQILKNRKENSTSVFPKLVFFVKKEINRNPTSPNYKCYQAALETSRTSMYPDYLSLDAGHIGDVYENTNFPLGPMGCRSYLSDYTDPKTGNLVYNGRGNVSVVTVHPTYYALKAGPGNIDGYLKLLTEYTNMALDINEWYHGEVSKLKGSANPLFFTEGGSWMSVEPNESVAEIIKGFTTSVGYIGLSQAFRALYPDASAAMNIQEEREQLRRFAELTLETMNQIIQERKEKTGILHSLYSTPAESLCYKFNNVIKDNFGVIEGVSDREYQTNSFHVDVWEPISAPDKIKYEAPFHQIATGGHISYVELPFGASVKTLESIVNYAMDKGMYFGVNIISTTCEDCGERGDFTEECPNCASHNLVVITRVCGYLAKLAVNDMYQQNPGKIAETFQRVKHN